MIWAHNRQASKPMIGAFPTHLEQIRGNNPRIRNARLGAIHSFYRFAALEYPEHAHTIARIMAIPTKRHQRNTVSYLDTGEITALLAAPDRRTWLSRRDHALMVLMIQTGIRVSELTGLRIGDVRLGVGTHIRVTGRDERCAHPHSPTKPSRSYAPVIGAHRPTSKCRPQSFAT